MDTPQNEVIVDEDLGQVFIIDEREIDSGYGT